MNVLPVNEDIYCCGDSNLMVGATPSVEEQSWAISGIQAPVLRNITMHRIYLHEHTEYEYKLEACIKGLKSAFTKFSF